MPLDWMQVLRLYTPAEAEKFWSYVKKSGPSECWEWQGYKNVKRFGYGACYVRGLRKTLHTHRVAYLLTHGGIPGGMHILHSCDNPPCCNPAHLRAGTVTDNVRDMHERNRWVSGQSKQTHCKNGHEFTAENTKTEIQANGKPRRSCRICSRAATAKSYRRQRERLAEAGLLKSRRPTHCQRGHEFTSDNTITRGNGRRYCRACRQASLASWYEKRPGVQAEYTRRYRLRLAQRAQPNQART